MKLQRSAQPRHKDFERLSQLFKTRLINDLKPRLVGIKDQAFGSSVEEIERVYDPIRKFAESCGKPGEDIFSQLRQEIGIGETFRTMYQNASQALMREAEGLARVVAHLDLAAVENIDDIDNLVKIQSLGSKARGYIAKGDLGSPPSLSPNVQKVFHKILDWRLDSALTWAQTYVFFNPGGFKNVTQMCSLAIEEAKVLGPEAEKKVGMVIWKIVKIASQNPIAKDHMDRFLTHQRSNIS